MTSRRDCNVARRLYSCMFSCNAAHSDRDDPLDACTCIFVGCAFYWCCTLIEQFCYGQPPRCGGVLKVEHQFSLAGCIYCCCSSSQSCDVGSSSFVQSSATIVTILPSGRIAIKRVKESKTTRSSVVAQRWLLLTRRKQKRYLRLRAWL